MPRAILILLLAGPALAASAPKNKAAQVYAELKAGLEAHMNGDDVKARRHLKACVKADPNDVNAVGCGIYLDWWAEGKSQIDKPSDPRARRLYSIGAEAYKQGNRKLAGAAWRECLEAGEVGTAVVHDCLAMVDLVPKDPLPREEAASREIYMQGFLQYGQGKTRKARENWLLCLDTAPKNGPTWSDCRAGMQKLYEDEKSKQP